MEFIVPIGIIIYIVLAVVSAVLKAFSTQQATVPQPSPVPMEVTEKPIQAEVEPRPKKVDAEYTPKDTQRPRPIQRPASSMDGRGRGLKVTKDDLKRAVVMSEVLREPRARRPWPVR